MVSSLYFDKRIHLWKGHYGLHRSWPSSPKVSLFLFYNHPSPTPSPICNPCSPPWPPGKQWSGSSLPQTALHFSRPCRRGIKQYTFFFWYPLSLSLGDSAMSLHSSYCSLIFHITLPTKVWTVKAIISPIVMYGCVSWTTRKAKHWRTDAFELWCWRRLLRVPWTAKKSNQSILKEINPEYSLEGLMLKLQYLGHLMWSAYSLEKTLTLGKIKGRRRRQLQRARWLDGIIDSNNMLLLLLLLLLSRFSRVRLCATP